LVPVPIFFREQHAGFAEDFEQALSANCVRAGPWRPFAVGDGNPVTGQQNFSSAKTVRLVIEALGR
jgi:putative intracellular protease/amidase